MVWKLVGLPGAPPGVRASVGVVTEHAPGLFRKSGNHYWRAYTSADYSVTLLNRSCLVEASCPLTARVGAPFVASGRSTSVLSMQLRGIEP